MATRERTPGQDNPGFASHDTPAQLDPTLLHEVEARLQALETNASYAALGLLDKDLALGAAIKLSSTARMLLRGAA